MKKIILLSLSLVAASAAYSEIRIIEPAPDAVVSLLTDAQKAYVSLDRLARREKFADAAYRRKEMGLPAETVPGAVSFILGALLGYDEDTLYLDWELTGFWNRNARFNHGELFDKLVKGFGDNYPADTIQESVVKYVRDLGFTDGDIAKFRSIMLAER